MVFRFAVQKILAAIEHEVTIGAKTGSRAPRVHVACAATSFDVYRSRVTYLPTIPQDRVMLHYKSTIDLSFFKLSVGSTNVLSRH